MAELTNVENSVRAMRQGRGWSQEELARRAGLSRAGVSAIESGRLVPSTAAALALSSAFGCRVEALFRLRGEPADAAEVWAWPAQGERVRFWRAEVGGRVRLYPVEATPLGVLPHDGVLEDGALRLGSASDPRNTLVLACCDPAAGLLAGALAEQAGIRLIVLPRSSGAALELLGRGLVHAAGLHLSRAGRGEGNTAVVQERLGSGYRLLRVADWEEGVALRPGLGVATIREAVASGARWVGREEGSGARQCLDEVLGGRRPPRRQALDHRGVAEAIRCGWADAGVCLRLAGEEAGLDFLGVRMEAYDLCIPAASEGDPRLRALRDVVRSPAFRRRLGELPGYDTAEAGEVLST